MPPHTKRVMNAFNVLDTLENELFERKNVNLFLDFDGTLAPIAQTPRDVIVPPETIGILKKINQIPEIFIAVISGRSIEDVRKFIRIDSIRYAGNHGFEISGVKKTEIIPNAAQVVRSIKKISNDLGKVLLTVPGAWVENKSLTASVHYREVAMHLVPEVNRLVAQIVYPYIERDTIRLTRGKKVIEIRPNIRWNKGHAVKWMLKKIAKKRATNIYIGDDETDEDAFKVLREGVTIKVSREIPVSSNARYFVTSPYEVRFFLQWMLERLSTRRNGRKK